MEITISLSSSDLERIEEVLGIRDYNSIHTAIVEAFNIMLDKEEKFINESWVWWRHLWKGDMKLEFIMNGLI